MRTNPPSHATIIQVTTFASPVGEITFAMDGPALCALKFAGGRTSVWPALARRYGPDVELAEASARHPAVVALLAYFDGDLDALDAIEVSAGGTPFQQRVWQTLRAIPVGQTASYADIAHRIGAPKAFRAVARANATNPVGIVIPCHRVIGADGALRGYGGGLERKAWLLEHERTARAPRHGEQIALSAR
ncbi:MAG: methylated-DNA--[protein]-cysteine S-methyltransferase [Dehalococcoidia bacterium]